MAIDAADEGIRWRVTGLSKLDILEFGGRPEAIIEEIKAPHGSFGEPATFTVTVALAGLSVLAAYLLRKHQNSSFEEVVEEIDPAGKISRRHVRWTSSSTEPPAAELIAKIRGGL